MSEGQDTETSSHTDKLSQRHAELTAQMTAVLDAAQTEQRGMTETEDETLRGLKAEQDRIAQQIELRAELEERTAAAAEGLQRLSSSQATLPAQPHKGVIEREAVYHPDNQHERSFFHDLTQELMDHKVRDRLERHARFEARRDPYQEREASTASAPGLVPPNYLIDEAVKLASPGRPFANSVRNLPLPMTGNTIEINVVTTGTSAAAQSAENASVSDTDIVGSRTSIPIITVAGHQDVSFQGIDRGVGVDNLIMEDMARAMAEAVENQCLNGTGASGQVSGIFKANEILAAHVVTDDQTTPSPALTWARIVKTCNTVVTGCYMTPDFVALHPRRLTYLLAATDGDGRPLFQPSIATSINVMGEGPMGYGMTGINVAGIPVVTSAKIPTDFDSNQDRVVAVAKHDCILWEGQKMTVTSHPIQNKLTHAITCYKYMAFKLRRSTAAAAADGTLFAATVS